jgi:hypothetical protein
VRINKLVAISLFLISTTYKRANMAGKLNLDRPSASIKQSRFICSPHPSLPQFTRPFHGESIAHGKKEGKLDCLSHDPDREHPVPFYATPLLPSTRFRHSMRRRLTQSTSLAIDAEPSESQLTSQWILLHQRWAPLRLPFESREEDNVFKVYGPKVS